MVSGRNENGSEKRRGSIEPPTILAGINIFEEFKICNCPA